MRLILSLSSVHHSATTVTGSILIKYLKSKRLRYSRGSSKPSPHAPLTARSHVVAKTTNVNLKMAGFHVAHRDSGLVNSSLQCLTKQILDTSPRRTRAQTTREFCLHIKDRAHQHMRQQTVLYLESHSTCRWHSQKKMLPCRWSCHCGDPRPGGPWPLAIQLSASYHKYRTAGFEFGKSL